MDDELDFEADELMDESEEDIALLLQSMQRQLATLEKKVDMLLAQSKGKPRGDAPFRDRPFRKGPFTKPPRSFERPNRYGREDRERSPRERDSSRSHYSERRKDDKPKSGKPSKKPYYSRFSNKD
jgi:hypothetical protein